MCCTQHNWWYPIFSPGGDITSWSTGSQGPARLFSGEPRNLHTYIIYPPGLSLYLFKKSLWHYDMIFPHTHYIYYIILYYIYYLFPCFSAGVLAPKNGSMVSPRPSWPTGWPCSSPSPASEWHRAPAPPCASRCPNKAPPSPSRWRSLAAGGSGWGWVLG